MDFRETFREIWVGCMYIFDKMRGKEPTPDVGARRVAYYEGAFGRPRPSQIAPGHILNSDPGMKAEKVRPALPAVEIEVEKQVDVEGERQWLGTGDDYGYGLGYIRREQSEGLEAQIEKELEKRGYTTRATAFTRRLTFLTFGLQGFLGELTLKNPHRARKPRLFKEDNVLGGATFTTGSRNLAQSRMTYPPETRGYPGYTDLRSLMLQRPVGVCCMITSMVSMIRHLRVPYIYIKANTVANGKAQAPNPFEQQMDMMS
jgi:hypothetical protein